MFAFEFIASVPAFCLYIPAPSTVKARAIEGAKVVASATVCLTITALVASVIVFSGLVYCVGTMALSIWLQNCDRLAGDFSIAQRPYQNVAPSTAQKST
jgi:hypothetical protein